MLLHACVFLIVLVCGLVMPGFVVEAQAAPGDDLSSAIAEYVKPVTALLHYLALSIILEMALTVVFNWRWFLKYAESKGLKTLIAILFAAIIVSHYELDIMNDILNAMGMCNDAHACKYDASKPTATSIGMAVTAFVLAGGSDAVFRILKKWGMRDAVEKRLKALGAVA